MSQHDYSICWLFQNHQNFVSFSSRDAVSVENLYQQHNHQGIHRIRIGNHTYDIDFNNMTQTNIHTTTSRSIKRVDLNKMDDGEDDDENDSYAQHQQQPPTTSSKPTNNHPNCPISFDKLQYPSQPTLEQKIKTILASLPTEPHFQSIHDIPSLTPLDFTRDAASVDVLQPVTPSGDDDCSVCFANLHPDEEAVRLPCSHCFHRDCIAPWVSHNGTCAACTIPVSLSPGKQPAGFMTIHYQNQPIPGEPQYGQIICVFDFPPGTQDIRHPDPGAKFFGIRRAHYMPASPQGFILLKLFTKAFLTLKLFSIGDSFTTGQKGVIVYSTIHCKSSPNAGLVNHSFPDPQFYENALKELKAANITPEWL